jgi:hypothetical protein
VMAQTMRAAFPFRIPQTQSAAGSFQRAGMLIDETYAAQFLIKLPPRRLFTSSSSGSADEKGDAQCSPPSRQLTESLFRLRKIKKRRKEMATRNAFWPRAPSSLQNFFPRARLRAFVPNPPPFCRLVIHLSTRAVTFACASHQKSRLKFTWKTSATTLT